MPRKGTLVENITAAWKDHTIEPHHCYRQIAKAIKPQTVNCRWRKLCPDIGYDSIGFAVEPAEIMKEMMGWKNRSGVRGSQNLGPGELQSYNRPCTREIHRRFGEVCQTKEDVEEATWEDSIFKTGFDFF